MLQVCGYNSGQLGIDLSNNVSPPMQVDLDVYSVLSYSIFCDYSIIIKRDGKLLAAGNNFQNKISIKYPYNKHEQYAEYTLKDKQGNKLIPLSVVCGMCQTLYLVTNEDHSQLQIVYAHQYLKEKYLTILNIGDLKPIALFSGYHNSAAITSEGAIIYVRETTYANPEKLIEPTFLPNGNKAISIACCLNFNVSLGSNGQVYISKNTRDYIEVEELRGIEITHISGVQLHCFAVSKNGKVYGLGSNSDGQLGLGKDCQEVSQFTEISSLNQYSIKAAYAGVSHSLFQTNEGKVLACGRNVTGALLLDRISNYNDGFYYLPIETTIKSDALFCIAGGGVSVVFKGIIPPNCPNRTITENYMLEWPISIYDAQNKIKELIKENLHLKSQIAEFNQQSLSPQIQHNDIQQTQFKILDRNEYQNLRQIREIGFGSSGKIVEVARDEKFALKIMHINDMSFEKQRNFLQEMEILSNLSHPNIIHAYGIYLSDETTPFSILLEFCPQDLNKSVSSLSSVEIAKTILQISLGMRYVHHCHLIHRDLKPQNILFGKDGLIRISDFGIAKLMTTDQSMTSGVGTQKFMAPEILNELDYNEKVDVYSFGVLLFFILTGGRMPAITIIQVGNGEKASIPSTFTQFAKNLIDKCWNNDPNERPSFKEICQQLEENNYSVINLTPSELNEVRNFANEHKLRIPQFSD